MRSTNYNTVKTVLKSNWKIVETSRQNLFEYNTRPLEISLDSWSDTGTSMKKEWWNILASLHQTKPPFLVKCVKSVSDMSVKWLSSHINWVNSCCRIYWYINSWYRNSPKLQQLTLEIAEVTCIFQFLI